MDNNTNVVTNEQEHKAIKGYKIFDFDLFNFDWTCRGFKYKVGKTYSLKLKDNEKLECCKNGFHFCTKLKDCFNYYGLNPYNKFAEVDALGNIDAGDCSDTKMCTDKIRIIREIPYVDILDLLNEGSSNNNGYGNIVSLNNRLCNIGSFNMGDCNIGEAIKGCWNKGNNNIGNLNISDCNSEDFNIENNNVASFNKCVLSSGSFCTSSPNYYLFNKSNNWTYKEWLNSRAYNILKLIAAPEPTEWIDKEEMTIEEKMKHPGYKVAGGYLRKKSEKEIKEEWEYNWNNMKRISKAKK